jgi:hypothetical protein
LAVGLWFSLSGKGTKKGEKKKEEEEEEGAW